MTDELKKDETPETKPPESMAASLGLIPTKEMGSHLMEAAKEAFKKERGKEVVAQVTRLMKELETARDWERKNRECAEIIEKKILAIEAGEFTINPQRQVVFNNDQFNKPYPHNMGFGY